MTDTQNTATAGRPMTIATARPTGPAALSADVAKTMTRLRASDQRHLRTVGGTARRGIVVICTGSGAPAGILGAGLDRAVWTTGSVSIRRMASSSADRPGRLVARGRAHVVQSHARSASPAVTRHARSPLARTVGHR